MESMEHQPKAESPATSCVEKEIGSSVQNVPDATEFATPEANAVEPSADPCEKESSRSTTLDEKNESESDPSSTDGEKKDAPLAISPESDEKKDAPTAIPDASGEKKDAPIPISAELGEKIMNNLGKTELWLAKNKSTTLSQLQKYTDEAKEKIDSVKKLLREGLSDPDVSSSEFIQETRQYVEEVFQCLESLCKKALECHDGEMHAALDELIVDMKADLELSKPEEVYSELKDSDSETDNKSESRIKKFREGPWMMMAFLVTMVAALGIAPSSIFQKVEDLMTQSSEFMANVTLF